MTLKHLTIQQILLFQFLLAGVHAGKYERKLIKDLLRDYDPYERPVLDDHSPMKVEFQITLQQIIDVDEKNQMINTNLWLTMKWSDYKLEWKPEEYDNITEIRLPAKLMWKPDILMYNSADPSFDGSWPVNMVIYSDGTVQQLPPGIFTSSCPINIRWFPFDDQACDLKFGSWTYDGTKIDLQILDGATAGSMDGYRTSGEWDLLGLPCNRNVILYDCCPDNPYIDLTYSIKIRRRKLYYLVNIVCPCMMLAALTLLTFTIPCDAGEKISFGVTILLSLTVFLLLVAEALPATSDSVPLIALYFAAVMLMNAASVVFTVVVLNYHHRSSESHDMPNWVRRGICGWLAWILRMKRPGHEITSRRLLSGKPLENRDIEMTEHKIHQNGCHQNLITSDNDTAENSPSLPSSPLMNGINLSAHKLRIDARSIAGEYSPTRLELRHILRELKFITENLKDKERHDQITSDWKFAATVVDRLMLWVFMFLTIGSSCAILFTAPNIVKGDEGI